jgi:hypothetical protein
LPFTVRCGFRSTGRILRRMNTKLAKTETKPRRDRPISKKLVQAIDSLLDGSCKNQKIACERFKLSPSYLSRSMRKDKIRVYVARRTSEAIAASQLPATATVLRLMENGKSEHVQFDAAKHMMALNGYHANPSAPGVNINISSEKPGYVIQLAKPNDEILEGEVGDAGGVLIGRRLTDAERISGVQTTPRPPAMIDVTPGADNSPRRHSADADSGAENASAAATAPSKGYGR